MRNFICLLIWTAAVLSLISCSAAPTGGTPAPSIYTADVTLSKFTYTGTAPVYILLDTDDSDDFRGGGFSTRGNLYTEGAVVDAAGTSDIVFSGIEFPVSEDPGMNSELFATLRIASDEDGSGDLNDGDIYMPEYIFPLTDGADITLPDITFDTGSTLVADVVGGINYQSRTFDLNIDVPDSDGTVYLFIEDSPDLSLGTYERRIPVPSSVITELRITTLPDDAPRDFYLLLFQDTNGNGQPDTGEPASADVPVTSVPFGFHIDPGVGDDGNAIQLNLSGVYSVQ